MGTNLLERATKSSPLLQEHQEPVVNPSDQYETGIASLQTQLAALVPSDAESARQITADAIQLVRRIPKLKLCDPVSIIGGLVTCAQLDLRPGVGGEAWLIPMRNKKSGQMEATLIIGYQGYQTLARRSELLGDVQAIRIYENDTFRFAWDYDRLEHEVNWQNPGEVIGWYAVTKLTNGIVRVERPWTVDDMRVHRDQFAMAKLPNGTIVGPWRDNFEAMADKTMILRALKNAPKSYTLQAGLWSDGGVRRNTDPNADVFAVTQTRDDLQASIEHVESGTEVNEHAEGAAAPAEAGNVEPAQ